MGDSASGWVLVVDDHELSRKLVEEVLEHARLQVRGAGSIAEAERIIATSAPGAIVLDLSLPDGHGLELARRCRSDPRTASCAIVACTAGQGPDEEDAAYREGCDAYVTKPIDTRRFPSLVAGLMEARAAA